MEDDGKTSFNMDDYYKVLKYLYNSRVDRQEPVMITEPTFVDGDSIVLPTIFGVFEGIDNLQLFLNCHSVDVDVSSVSLGFSPLLNGNAKLLSLNCIDNTIDNSTDTLLQFTVDENYSATDKSRKLTGIESIVVDFGKDATGVEIQNIVMRSIDYTYTLEDLDIALENGEAYVLRRLNDLRQEREGYKEIPKLLKQYIYMAAGAYAWLTRWEYEAKPMKEPKSESNNYADRLFTQVDDAITKYLSNIENNRNEEYLHLHQATYGELTWGVR